MDYHLKPLSKKCAQTGEELVPGTVCYSVLIEENDEMVRLDFSEAGRKLWQGEPIGAWQCIVPEPIINKKPTIDADGLMAYFDQMTEDANPAQEKLRYVLALLLLQKRRVRLEGSHHDGKDEYIQVSGSQGEGMYEVRDFQLEEDEMHELQESLNAHLMQEWAV